MKSVLKTLAHSGAISNLSLYFAEFIAQQSHQAMDDLVVLSAALVSEANQQGDVCIMLDRYQSQPLFSSTGMETDALPLAPNTADWQAALLSSCCVGLPGQIAPLILEDSRLYLYRYWYYESELAKAINTRLANPVDIDEATLLSTFENLYPEASFSRQKLAVLLAVKQRFAIISGGPGTGKTTTVIHILAVLLSQQSDMRIKLAAPTGKAAARMMESIRQGIDRCHLSQRQSSKMPTQASTIHRLLGYGRHGFRYSRQRLLALDCIIIDEASMVDIRLMYHLLDALPPHARIILLGDRDQLASVTAGNVLADITGQGQAIHYSKQQLDWLHTLFNSVDTDLQPSTGKMLPPADAIALLTRNYRFDVLGDISQLAQLINAGEKTAVINLLQHAEKPLQWYRQTTDSFDPTVLQEILDHYQAVIQARSIDIAFDAFESVRVLCAIHSGPFGVNAINQCVDTSMRMRGWIESHADFHGKPLLIDTNDYELELFNGDVGLLWRGADHKLRAYFRDLTQGLRCFPIASLPKHRPAWAMTVHKSQGSEFDFILLVLPGHHQKRALSRELMYTGITRTRQALSIYASAEAIETACASHRQRHSGLAAKLGWPDSSG